MSRCIEKKRNGRYRVRYMDSGGHTRQRSFARRHEAERFQKTLGLAQEHERAFRDMLAAGHAVGIETQPITFAALAAEWSKSYLTDDLRPSWQKDLHQSLKRLTEALGPRELRTITTADLEQLRNELLDRIRAERTARLDRVLDRAGAVPIAKRSEREASALAREPELRAAIARGGPRTVAKVIAHARMLWKFAISRGYVERNVADHVRKPKAPPAAESGVIDANILTPSEVARLLEATPPEHRTTVEFLFLTGVRLGELCGAQWSDVDWASGRIFIRRQRSALTGELTEPKTRAGRRWVDLPEALLRRLKAHRLATKGEFLFPNVSERNFRDRVWHPALRRAGLRRIRIHDARHTCASMLIAAGADVVAVSRRLGHANPSITLNTYSHQFARRDAAPLGEQLAAFMIRENGAVLGQAAKAPVGNLA